MLFQSVVALVTAKLENVIVRRRQSSEREKSEDDWFAAVCGVYPVQSAQLEVFKQFSITLKKAAVAFSAVAFTNIALTLLQVRLYILLLVLR